MKSIQFLQQGPVPASLMQLNDTCGTSTYPVACRCELSKDPESAVRAHARDELGIDVDEMDNPFEAMFSSLFAFVIGALFPLLAAVPFVDYTTRTAAVVASSCVGLLVMGVLSGVLGGASPVLGAVR
eukprot:scaffold649891_cov45-Prasinocladus_malaysianus.AAC.1